MTDGRHTVQYIPMSVMICNCFSSYICMHLEVLGHRQRVGGYTETEIPAAQEVWRCPSTGQCLTCHPNGNPTQCVYWCEDTVSSLIRSWTCDRRIITTSESENTKTSGIIIIQGPPASIRDRGDNQHSNTPRNHHSQPHTTTHNLHT
jgi:hypothetical protein